MRLSVLIVSYNVRQHLAACLRSLRAAGEAEIVVADNESGDGTPAMLQRDFPEVLLVPMEGNRGFSAAVNAAARRATGDAFLLLNPDTELGGGALPRMLDRLEAQPEAAVVGFRQVDSSGLLQLAAGPGPSLLFDLGRRLVQKRLDRGDRRVAALIDRWLDAPRPVPWVAGSTLLVRRDDFEAVGGFDEAFFLYFEDIDFCLRLGHAGRRVIYDPTITVVHHRGVSAAGARGLAARAYRDSQALFWRKHRGGLAAELVALYAALRRQES